MLIVTEPKYIYNNLDYLRKNAVIFNLNATINVDGAFPLCLTPPLNTLGRTNVFSQEFDDWYVQQLLTSEALFMNLMSIMCNLRDGRDVILLCYRGSEAIEAMNEALVKLIQIRYGYNYQIVDSVDGIDYYDQSTFTTPGILQFDYDYARYESLLIKYGQIDIYAPIDESHI